MKYRQGGYVKNRNQMTDEEFEEYLAEIAAMTPEEKKKMAARLDTAQHNWNMRQDEWADIERRRAHREIYREGSTGRWTA